MKVNLFLYMALAATTQASWTFDAACPAGVAHPQHWAGSKNKGCTALSNCNAGGKVRRYTTLWVWRPGKSTF